MNAVLNRPPCNLYFDGDIKFESDSPVSQEGGFGILYRGTHGTDGCVALKQLRIRGSSGDRRRYLNETLAEARVWRNLGHEHVLPFLGILFQLEDVYLVSPFLEQGSLPHYIAENPGADRAKLLREVASGLAYLHSQGVIHGDVKGGNVLVSSFPSAMLCDFGLSKMLDRADATTRGGVGTLRWQSPELMDGGRRTFESDVYAYGITIAEIINGEIPFSSTTDSGVVVTVVVRDERPVRKPGNTPNEEVCTKLWNVGERCWLKDPATRPSMPEVRDDVFAIWSNFLPNLSPSTSTIHVNVKIDAASKVEWTPLTAVTPRDNRLSKRPIRDSNILEILSKPVQSFDAAAATETPMQRGVFGCLCFTSMRAHLKPNILDLPILWTSQAGVDDLIGKTEDIVSAELQFACTHWAHYASRASPQDHQIINAVEGFIEVRAIWWLEVMSLLGKVPHAMQSLKAIQDWAKRSHCSTQALQLLNDLCRFTAAHATSIIAGPHHLYLSALPYVPRDTRLWALYGDEAAQSLKVVHGLEPNWTRCLNNLNEHSGSVSMAKFSPDGARIASSSWDNTVRVWDAVYGAPIFKLEGHHAGVMGVAWSPDGKRIISNSRDCTIRVWDAGLGICVSVLEGHSGPVKIAVCSPDGSRIASGSDDRTVRVWDLESGAPLYNIAGHNDEVNVLAFHPGGLRLSSGGFDGTSRVWDLPAGTSVSGSKAPWHWINALAFSPDGTHVASASADRKVRVWTTGASDEEVSTLVGHDEAVTCLAFSPDGTRIVSGSDDQSIRVWSMIAPELKLLGHVDRITAVTFSPYGLRVASASHDGTIKIWDTISGTMVISLDRRTSPAVSITFSPDGSRLVSTHDHMINVWDVASEGLVPRLQGHSDAVETVIFSPDGSRVASGSNDCIVRVLDAITGAHLLELVGHTAAVNRLAFSLDGARLASSSYDGTIRVWGSSSGTLLSMLVGHVDDPTAHLFSPDGVSFASCSPSTALRVWDTDSVLQLVRLQGEIFAMEKAAFSPDGSRIAAAKDSMIIVWNVLTGKRLLKLDGGTGAINTLGFSPRGYQVVCGTSDARVHIWDALSGESLLQLDHSASVKTMIFSVDCKWVACGTRDGDVRIWNTVSGDEISEPDDPGDLDWSTLINESDTIQDVEASASTMSASQTFSSLSAARHIQSSGDDESSLNTTLRPFPISYSGQWLYAGPRHDTSTRLSYVPDEFEISRISSYPPMSPTRVALGCWEGQVLILDLSPMFDLE